MPPPGHTAHESEFHRPDAARQAVMLLLFLAIVFTVSAFGAQFTDTGPGSWYATLNRPDWSPPGWVFGPVWTVLYILIAMSGWLAWRERGFPAGPFTLYAVQLGLNAAWTPLFFGMQNPLAGFLCIMALWVAILLNILAFHRIRPLAAGLLAPYLGWVTFAAVLNYAILQMNP